MGGVVFGIILLGVGVWLGFIGWEETRWDGVYQVTYPGMGIILLIFGIVVMVGGLAESMKGPERPIGTPRLVDLRRVQPESDLKPLFINTPPVQMTRTCQKCGAKMPDDARFCNTCGATVSQGGVP